MANFVGTALADTLVGLDENDTMSGLGGEDNIEGRGGADIIDGGDGDDFLKGEGGDSYNGLFGNDTLNGGLGDDVLRGGDGVDILNGGDGFDRVTFFARAATEGAVASLLTQTVSNDGFGNTDTITSIEGLGGGTAFVDSFTGDNGTNLLIGGFGDTLLGLGGDDIFQLDGATATLDGGAGNDTLESFSGRALIADGDADGLADVLLATVGVIVNLGTGAIVNDGFGNSTTIVSIENVGGSSLADQLTGTAAANTLQGFDGADVLNGGGGNDLISAGDGADTINGGTGIDTMLGGSGADTFIVDNVRDLVIETSALGGIDTVQSSVTFRLGVNVERLTLTGAAAINGTGNTLNNVITGNAGANVLNGGGGDDTLIGGDGDDTYILDTVGDLASESSATGGVDLIQTSATRSLGANIENLTLTGAAAINGTGNSLANIIVGNNGANTLNGALGADTLTGGGGADNFVFTTAVVSSNVDTLTDFNVAADSISLENAIFTAVGVAGALVASRFVVGAAAADAGDRIIYNAATGALFYDADGTGAGAQVQFASLTAGLALTAADFIVI